MSRYISAELIKELMKRDRFMQGNAEWVMWQQEVDRRVDSMPSIEIVRCQDCKCTLHYRCRKCQVCLPFYNHTQGRI